MLFGTNQIKFLLFFVVIWILLVYYFISRMNPSSLDNSEESMRRLNQAVTYLEQSKNINDELQGLIEEYMR
jgi:glycoprotein 6-alpha-L-fucosyltransferase